MRVSVTGNTLGKFRVHVLVMGLVMALDTGGLVFMLTTVAFHTGHLAVSGRQGRQRACNILMTTGTEFDRNGIAKGYVGRAVGFMALKAVLQGHLA